MELIMFIRALVVIALAATAAAAAAPLPFTRVIEAGMSGNDVLVAQNLLARFPGAHALNASGVWDAASASALAQFQQSQHLAASGNVDADSATALLLLYSDDGIRDTGFTARSMGYKYKLVVTCSANRSIEHTAQLFDADNALLHAFTVRTHGHRDHDPIIPWPDFGDNDVGLNQFSSNGATVTGVIEIDLNTPEPDPRLYGPYPVNRLVRGLKGNAAFLLPNIRDGQLLHTGNWTTSEHVWTPEQPMPNSEGCIHAHPADVQRISELLVSIGVVANPNPFSGKQYPFAPQGIAVVQQI